MALYILDVCFYVALLLLFSWVLLENGFVVGRKRVFRVEILVFVALSLGLFEVGLVGAQEIVI